MMIAYDRYTNKKRLCGMEETISQFMGDEHKIIEQKVGELEAGNISFIELRAVLEDHFRLEEKAIYDFCDIETFNQVRTLLWEHKSILGQLARLSQELSSTGSMDFSRLKSLLMKHKEEEDSSFYPMLDEKLTMLQKEQIITNLRTMSRSHK